MRRLLLCLCRHTLPHLHILTGTPHTLIQGKLKLSLQGQKVNIKVH
jgi:hypothetical protein